MRTIGIFGKSLVRFVPGGKLIAGTFLIVGLLISSGYGDATDSFAVVAPKHNHISVRRNGDGSLKFGPSNSLESYNWSGYALENFATGQTYTSASASWTVPKVSFQAPAPTCHPISSWGFSSHVSCFTPSLDTEYTSSWVGIGGICENASCTLVDSTLIQLGTEQEVSADGATFYYAWYEMLPNAETMITSPVPCGGQICNVPRPVFPGDSITASLACQTNCTSGQNQTWLLTLTDATQKWTFSKTVTYTSTLASVEWIQEAPSSNAGILPLADFATVTFNPTYNGSQNPNIPNSGFGSIGVDAITMVNSYGATSVPSPVARLDAFSTCWGNNMAYFANCPAP